MLCVVSISSCLQHLSAQGQAQSRCWIKVSQLNKLQRPCSPNPEVQQAGRARTNPRESYLLLQGIACWSSWLLEEVEAEQTKGFQKVGGGSPTQLENFTESRFQAIFKISEDLATPSLHIPMATPAGAERPAAPCRLEGRPALLQTRHSVGHT